MDENIKASIQNVAAKIGGDVADAFGKKVRAVLDDVDNVSRRVSIPIDYALVYLVTMIFVIIILVMVVWVNAAFVHSGIIWTVLGGGFGAEMFVILLVWYLHRKGWG